MIPTTSSSPCILFALDREGYAFRRLFGTAQKCQGAPCRAWEYSSPEAKSTMLVVESGIGLVRAQRALEWVLAEKGRPSFLVMAGYAGGLQDHLRLGEVVVAQEIVDHEGHRWPTTWPPASLAPDLPRVRLLTSPTLLGDPQEKRRLGQLHQAQIVDMEAAAVARFCTEHGISFACVRALSDDVNTALSPELVTLLAAGQVSIPQVLKALLLRPRLLGELINLGRHTRLASEKLAEGLQRLLR